MPPRAYDGTHQISTGITSPLELMSRQQPLSCHHVSLLSSYSTLNPTIGAGRASYSSFVLYIPLLSTCWGNVGMGGGFEFDFGAEAQRNPLSLQTSLSCLRPHCPTLQAFVICRRGALLAAVKANYALLVFVSFVNLGSKSQFYGP